MAADVKKTKVLIFNSYGVDTGGGSQIQSSLKRIVSACLPYADVRVFPLVNNTRGVVSYLQSFWAAAVCYVKNTYADLFILQSYLDPGMLVLGALARKNKTPYILIPGGDLVPSGALFFKVRNPFLKWVFWLVFGRCFVNNALAVVVTSELEKQRLVKVGANSKKFHTIPNSLPDKFYQAAEKYFRAPKGVPATPFVLWLGRISDEKGLLFLVECWKRVALSCPQAKLFLVGPIDHRDAYLDLAKSIRRLDLDSVVFLPWADESRKIQLLYQARCLVLPSYCESFGITAMEAIIMRTHVIASTGTPWPQIDGIAGKWLPHDHILWSNAMIAYLSSPSKQYIAMEAVSKLLRPYTNPNIFKKWTALLQEKNA